MNQTVVDFPLIKGVLASKHLTQRKLAKFMKIDPSHLCRLLRGERRINDKQLQKVAKFLKCNSATISIKRGGTNGSSTK
jgi:transcriptional regulator with XRE-family HTH domain